MRRTVDPPRRYSGRQRVLRGPGRMSRIVKTLGLVLSIVGLWFALANLRPHFVVPSSGPDRNHEELDIPLTLRCTPRVDEGVDSVDPCSRPFVPVSAPRSPFPRLARANLLPENCLEAWLERGVVQCPGISTALEPKLDVVWTWVNGSDLRWREAMARASHEEGIYSPGFHFREQNELQYSVRSVLGALGDSIGNAHILVADFPWNSHTESHLVPESWRSELGVHQKALRVAQTPRWLDFESVGCSRSKVGRPTLQLVTHSDIFHLPSNSSKSQVDVEREWREKALPSFNSKVIESRLGWIPGLGEVVLSFNDDFFLLRPHTTTDFYSLFYGTVVRMDEGYYQQVRPVLDRKNVNDAGETGGLWHANYLLSKRFPKRLRPYLPHVPKVVTRGLHHEAALMFKDELYLSTQRRFRESKVGRGDIQLQWLSIALRIERWREALLWTFLVAQLGTLEPSHLLGPMARSRLRQLLGLEGSHHPRPSTLTVSRGRRETLAAMPSLDGHMPPIPRPGTSASTNDQCTLDLTRCLGDFWTHDVEAAPAVVFKRVAFEYPDCGDCLIMALVKASGPKGLSAFLPSTDSVYTLPLDTARSSSPETYPPILPLNDNWQEADFELQAVMRTQHAEGPEIPLRHWSVQLLSRYLYVTGRSSTQFHMITDAGSVTQACDAIDRDPSASMLGLNDNVLYESDETKSALTEWFQRRWPEAGWWERT